MPYRPHVSRCIGRPAVAEDREVRDFVGVLKRGQTFEVKGFNTNEWVYGFAYGNVNANGVVQNGWIC